MKKVFMTLSALLLISTLASCAVKNTVPAHKKIHATKKVKVIRNIKKVPRFTKNKNAVRQTKVLKMIKEDNTIKKDGRDMPKTDPSDIHPSQQF